ncbi:MAG: UDP-N-acetylmuramoyl-tripeptide--D-alanyl-D-alanine ligase [Acidimicrobiales bacterium]
MVQFLLSELATAIDGRLLGLETSAPGVDTAVSVTDLSIDSRSVTAGQLFVPIVAERDGHEFIDSAVANGAGAYLTSGPMMSTSSATGGSVPAVLVADTMTALTAIGKLARSRMTGAVIGITGSVGKTSVKDLTLAACRSGGSVSASLASFNNEMGVPLTLANAADGVDIAIVEMGARGIGHIAELAEVAAPTIGVVTCVALAHSELFGNLEGVAQAKGELVEALPASGVAVLNGDDPLVAAMASRTAATAITFGTGAVDVRATGISVDRELKPTFTIESDWGTAQLTLQVRGAHMAQNAAAAVAAAVSAGIDFSQAIEGLRSAELSPWRMSVAETEGGLVVVNDAYNANPTSMRAAIQALLDVPAQHRVAVLGVMAELGIEGPEEHLAVAREATAAGIRVIAVDAEDYGRDVEHVVDRHEAYELLGSVGAGDAVLVKGSRVAGLELLAEQLLDR